MCNLLWFGLKGCFSFIVCGPTEIAFDATKAPTRLHLPASGWIKESSYLHLHSALMSCHTVGHQIHWCSLGIPHYGKPLINWHVPYSSLLYWKRWYVCTVINISCNEIDTLILFIIWYSDSKSLLWKKVRLLLRVSVTFSPYFLSSIQTLSPTDLIPSKLFSSKCRN